MYCSTIGEGDSLIQLTTFKLTSFMNDYIAYMESDKYQLFIEAIKPISKIYAKETL